MPPAPKAKPTAPPPQATPPVKQSDSFLDDLDLAPIADPLPEPTVPPKAEIPEADVQAADGLLEEPSSFAAEKKAATAAPTPEPEPAPAPTKPTSPAVTAAPSGPVANADLARSFLNAAGGQKVKIDDEDLPAAMERAACLNRLANLIEANVDEFEHTEVEQQSRRDQQRVLAALARHKRQPVPMADATLSLPCVGCFDCGCIFWVSCGLGASPSMM